MWLLCLDLASDPGAAAFFMDVLGALLLALCTGSVVTYREAHWVLLSYAGTADHVLLHLCLWGRCGSCTRLMPVVVAASLELRAPVAAFVSAQRVTLVPPFMVITTCRWPRSVAATEESGRPSDQSVFIVLFRYTLC